MYEPFMFSTLLSSYMTLLRIASRCLLAAAPPFIQPLHLDQVTTSLSRLYLNTCSFGPSLIGYPAVPSFPLASPIVLVSFSLFLLLIFVTCPFSHLLSTIHELVTKTKEQCDDFFYFA